MRKRRKRGKASGGSKFQRRGSVSEAVGSAGRKGNRQVKDRLFRFLFEKDREALLQLYNGLNGTGYGDASLLQVVTIEGTVYMVMKNDLAFVLAGTLNLYEHQSTINPNMPVRMLVYLAQEYQKVVETAEESLYGSKLLLLPAPRCVVFYNGKGQMPEEQELRLSDAFGKRKGAPDLELKVRVYNINYGYNKELLGKCRLLEEYAMFVEACRQCQREGSTMQEALDRAVNYCISHGILSEILRIHRGEVLGMLLEEFDAEKYERTIRKEGIEIGLREGRLKGRQEGRLEGQQQGMERANKLTAILLSQKRIADLERSIQETAYQEMLFQEFGL